jgi:hypothetical protein
MFIVCALDVKQSTIDISGLCIWYGKDVEDETPALVDIPSSQAQSADSAANTVNYLASEIIMWLDYFWCPARFRRTTNGCALLLSASNRNDRASIIDIHHNAIVRDIALDKKLGVTIIRIASLHSTHVTKNTISLLQRAVIVTRRCLVFA